MRKTDIKKFGLIKSAALAALFLIFLPLSTVRETAFLQGAGKCELIPLGQIPKRELEIRDQLIFLAGYMIEKYEKLINHAANMAHLVSSCDIKECEKGDCTRGQNFGLTCDPGEKCAFQPGDDDICADGIKEDMEKEYEAAEKIVEEIKSLGGLNIGLGTCFSALQTELLFLRNMIGDAQHKLAHGVRDETNTNLWSCFEAKTKTPERIKSCKKSIEITPCASFNILNEADHGFDYYICPK